jgi:hypothetical protein
MMKKIIVVISLMLCFKTEAQIPIIGTIIAKVIKAIDLKVQRMQNEVLALQNVQRNIENGLHKLKLNEIADWSAKQKKLYEDYFKELRVVKKSIAEKTRIRTLVDQQLTIAGDYTKVMQATPVLFNVRERKEIQARCDLLLQKSLHALDQAEMVSAGNNTSMPDEARLGMLDDATGTMLQAAKEMEIFRQSVLQENKRRIGERNGIESMKKLYSVK